jgi:hypothetical protein
MLETYTISKSIYYNNCTQQYENILTIDRIPEGNLRKFVRQIKPEKRYNNECHCLYAFSTTCLNWNKGYLLVNDIPHFYSFLLSNNYTIDTKLTNMTNLSGIKLMPNLICFVSLTSEHDHSLTKID